MIYLISLVNTRGKNLTRVDIAPLCDVKKSGSIRAATFLPFISFLNDHNCFEGAGFNFPVHTGLPCNRRTAYIIPTVIKNNGPRKPKSATNFVP